MTYRKGTSLPVQTYNFPLFQGGLGDTIGQLPAVEYCLKTHPQLVVNLVVHKYAIELCQKAFQKYGNRVKVTSMDDPENYNENLPARSPSVHRITNLSMHITDHAFMTIVGRTVPDHDKNYITIDPIDVSHLNLPSRYAVITTGFTSEVREWLPEYVNGVSDYLVSRGITPVYLGKSYTPAWKDNGIVGTFKANYDNGINLIDRTDMFEAHAVMDGALFVCGLDNGLLHLAGMSARAKIIAGFTTVLPEHRLPYREGKLGHNCFTVTPTKEELKCIGCQSNMSFAGHDFRECFYEDRLCTTLMTPDRWIVAIEKALAPQTPEEKAERAYQTIVNTQKINKEIEKLFESTKLK